MDVANGKNYMVGTVYDETRGLVAYSGPDDPLRSFYTGFLPDHIRAFYALGGGLWFGEGTFDVEFGANVTGIGSNMLSTCGAFMRIVMNSTVPQTLGYNALPPVEQFEQFKPYAVIFVPASSVDAYKNAEGWSEYKDYIKAATVPGSEDNPWLVGKTAIAWANGTGRLGIKGAGEAELMPWSECADGIAKLDKDKGVAQFGVVVSTNGELTAATESWGKAKVEDVGLDEETGEAILTVSAPAEKGFFIINPKPDVPSDISGPVPKPPVTE